MPIVIKKDNDGSEAEATFRERFFIYSEHKLIRFKDDEKEKAISFLDIKFARLKKKSLRFNDTKVWGFLLMAKGNKLIFYLRTEEECS